MEGERGKLRQSLEELQQLHSQVSGRGQGVRMCPWTRDPGELPPRAPRRGLSLRGSSEDSDRARDEVGIFVRRGQSRV